MDRNKDIKLIHYEIQMKEYNIPSDTSVCANRKEAKVLAQIQRNSYKGIINITQRHTMYL